VRSILVVDEDPDVAELFRQRFRRETRQGTYVLHYAASGEEALDRLSGDIEPELLAVLSDINMPGMGGLQRRRRAAAHGAAQFLTKPVDFEHLKKQLSQLPTAAG